MEIYNWGTFDNQIFKIEPKGNNSLLTGANGSGKTTFIDALLTLLVPLKNDRFYNQSSGVQKKGDRNEESYVLGHYGDIQKEGDLSATTQKLRDKTTYSVLLASFSNTDEKIITLFQVRSFTNGAMKVTFGIAYKTLNIQTDFSNFDSIGNLKRRLYKIHNETNKKWIEYFDGPSKYAERLRERFGMSKNALSLFNQVVGIKVLGDLDEFIKTNMLEKRDAENEYNQLKDSFITLINAKNDIDKAKEQIKQLEPINSIANQLEELDNKLDKIKKDREDSVYWFAQKGLELADTESKKLESLIQEIDAKLKTLKENKTDLEIKKTKLSVQIEKNEVTRQINDLKIEIGRLSKSRDNRKLKLDHYNKLIVKLEFKSSSNEKEFIETRNLAQEKKKNSSLEIEKEREVLRLAKNKSDEIKINIEDGIETIKSLQSNNNNITGNPARIREEILKNVGATKDEIPFIGELIKVDDLEWESSIEKVLHNFALRLIVPEKYYQPVNKYVNRTNLKGRIIYERYKEFTSLKSLQNYPNDKNLLINKISFRPNSKYVDWVEHNIINQFNYICANNLSEFNTLDKAITKEGLIKRKGRHEKDDRKKITDRNNYVLGWDNKDKINWWKIEIKKLHEEEKKQKNLVRGIEKQIKYIELLKDNLSHLFNSFTKFDEIDWKTYAKKIQEKEEQKKILENTNDEAKALQEQLEKVQSNLNKNEEEIDSKKDLRRIENGKWESAKLLITSHSAFLNQFSENKPDLIDFEQDNEILNEINYSNFSSTQKTFQDNIETLNKDLKDKKNDLTIKVSSKINAFKNPPENILIKYKSWRSDVHQLPTSLEFISEYQKKYNDLIEEGLPSFEEKFNNYLQATIEDKVANFKFFFDKWSDDIKENIGSLNDSLEGIDFSSYPTTTFIQLKANTKREDNIIEFKRLLHDSIPNFKEFENSIDAQKNHFNNNIEPFIRLLENEKWREKIMDVRSWFEYNAEEISRETNQRTKTYTGMGQLSGGEKAQLTYTILGSAIAYQFGLTKEGMQTNSFRFIAIDEAFKAQDEEKAKYLINLCKQLHLQLLVVTPSDNIHIVENDISFVHYVERRNDKISWLYDMTIEQFLEEKSKYITE
ncbi:ATP-binding protein [Pontimicrobium sp. MEBiC06410]